MLFRSWNNTFLIRQRCNKYDCIYCIHIQIFNNTQETKTTHSFSCYLSFHFFSIHNIRICCDLIVFILSIRKYLCENCCCLICAAEFLPCVFNFFFFVIAEKKREYSNKQNGKNFYCGWNHWHIQLHGTTTLW